MALRSTLLGLLLLALPGPAAAEPAGPGLQSLRFEHLTAEQLGATAALQCAVQDELGQMWLGTNVGLIRYDGRRGKLFQADARDPASLSHGWIQALLWQADGQLLVATADGLNVLNPRTETNQRVALPGERRPAQRVVKQLQPATAGRAWVMTHFELLQYETGTRRFSTVVLEGLRKWQDDGKIYMHGMQADGLGGIWLLAGAELLHVQAGGQISQRWPLAAAPPGRPQILSLALDADGRAWVGGNGWIQVIDLRDGRQLDLPGKLGIAQRVVHALMSDDQGTVWVGTGGGGLWRVRRGSETAEVFHHHPAVDTSPTSDSISAFFQDRSGVLWVGTWTSTISLVDLHQGGWRSYASVFSEPDSLPNDSVFAIEAEDERHLWVGTYGNGVARLDLQTGRAAVVDSTGLAANYVRSLQLQPGRGLWVGTDTGLFLLPPGERRLRVAPLGRWTGKLSVVSTLTLDAAGTLLIGSRDGLHQLSPDGQVQALPVQVEGGKAGLNESRISTVLQDREARLWVGTDRGLRLRVGERFVQPLVAEAGGMDLDALNVHSLAQDRQGRLWMGSEIGLFELQPAAAGRWRARSLRDLPGMPDGRVINLQFDAADGLWFASAAGLVRLDPQHRRVQQFAGLARRFVAGASARASAHGSQGRLYFGQSGLAELDPAAVGSNPTPPLVLLSDLQVYNRSLREAGPGEKADDSADASARSLAELGVQGALERAQTLRLSHREAMVSFDLRAQHFFSPGQIRYAWKLDGFDKRWIEGRPGQGLATYTNLDAGHFRLLARAANPDGVWSEPRQLLELEVLPPWWKATWFRLLLALLMLALLAAAWQLRLRHLQRTQRQLEDEVARRTAEVRAQRQQIATLSEIGRELTASLDLGAIQRALFSHVESLMPATVFGVGLVNKEERVVEFDFMVERGKAFKPYRRSLDVLEQPAARCVASGEAFLIGEFEHDNRVVDAGVRAQEGERLQLVDGSEPRRSRSAIYVPLKVKGDVIGVLSVLSDQAAAFNQTHLDMLQTLGTYAAVALDNAEAYRQLQQAQTRLVAQEKLASLGSLVAGVAHEMNTPLGNALMAASTLKDETRQLGAAMSSGQLRRSELQAYGGAAEGGFELLLRSLERAANLVGSFKQLAVDQVSEQRRQFELADLVGEIQLSHAKRLRDAGHELQVQVPQGLVLDSYPGPLGQVLGHLISNALVHGLEGRRGGVMCLWAEAVAGERLRLRFSDDGRGIAPEHLGRVFDPFFTTKMGSGGNGLGLHLCYTIVDSLLGGQITVSSTPGQGTVLELLLPRQAPP